MKSRKILVVLATLALFVFGLSYVAMGQEKATPQEIVKTVQDAANTLAKSGQPGLAEFGKKAAPWVWKDTYIFALDCAKGVMAAHPMKPELVGKDILAMKDTKGNLFFGQLCEATNKPAGVWVEYWWPKPGQTEGFRKISYALKAGDTPYVVGAGIYDDTATTGDLAKLAGGGR
jgi:cytochrome c